MIFPISIKSRSYTDTESVGVDLARAILENTSLPRFLALYGDLGVGKTAFTRGFTSVIAPSARVKSPTFALVNQYKGEEISVFVTLINQVQSKIEAANKLIEASTPQRGTDYWTEEDKAEIKSYVDEAILGGEW